MNEPRRDASIPAAQREIADSLARLAGRGPSTTHISAVFVGVDEVWKLKKAVRHAASSGHGVIVDASFRAPRETIFISRSTQTHPLRHTLFQPDQR